MHDIYLRTARELSDANLTEQGLLRLKVTSQSMAPLLQLDDHVLVQSALPASLQRGDLIVTRREDGYLTHRLVAVDGQGWHTKGDRNHTTDAPVDASAIVGLVITIERHGKLHNVRTRLKRWMARLHGWLGWLEIKCHSQFEAWFTRMLSRVLEYVFRC